MRKTRKNVDSHSVNRSHTSIRKMIKVLVNTSTFSKVYATTLLQLGNLSQTKIKFSISSQASGMTKICWWVSKKPTQSDDIPQALAALTLDNTIVETEWTSDTGASNHMTVFFYISYSTVGGLSDQIGELRESIELPLMNPELFLRFGIKPPKVIYPFTALSSL
ncbi:26S proteasome regulatory subunit S10B-like B [Glycine soja]|uniref:26S proteasome regulatory subunit S10B-like B n=1 Tax=Glycine soja TaxID=3848 RepID=A0A445I4L5_GLYSO|nr:26S proteasome regulatory subunit S10B-like B [Glycine soja]